jgi:hypothetical protein
MTSSTTAAISAATPDDIVIQINTINQLFNAPEINPFSDKPIDVAGESALTRMVRQLLSRYMQKSEGTRLIIQMPADQITPGLQTKTAEAVRRYADAKIKDNKLNIRVSRRVGLIELLVACAVAMVALVVTTAVLAGPLAGLSETLRGFILGFVSILAWVLLWNPLDKLLFAWIEPRERIAILRKIKSMDIVIEPQTEN